MKIQTENRTLETSGDMVTSEFKINASPQAFQALSDGLYSDKIGTILRELGANCGDSHELAGKGDVPFNIHLPTLIEPWLELKDEGVGLSEDSMDLHFTTYFGSNKSDSNDLIGGFGLGCKSPFLYTEQFSVTSWHNNHKYLYTMYKNDRGTLNCSLISKTPSNEVNGVAIKLDVQKKDISEFETKAKSIYDWFDVRPNFNKHIEFEDRKVFLQGTKWYMYEEDRQMSHSYGGYRSQRKAYARMGSVVYPIESQHTTESAILSSYNVIMDFDIGELSVVLSREALSYNENTIRKIKNRIKLMEKEYEINFIKKVNDPAKSYVACCKAYAAIYNESSYQMKREIDDYKIMWRDTYAIKHKVECILQKDVYRGTLTDIKKFDSVLLSSLTAYDQTKRKIRISRNFPVMWRHIFQNDLFIVNDLKLGLPSRIRHYIDENANKDVPLSFDNVTILQDTTDVADFLKFYEVTPEYTLYASTMDKPPSVTSGRSSTMKIGYYTRDGVYSDNDPDFDIKSGGYYMPMVSNAYIVDNVNTSFDIDNISRGVILRLFREEGIVSADDKFYELPATVRKSSFKKLTNWVNFWEFAEKELKKLFDKRKKEYYIALKNDMLTRTGVNYSSISQWEEVLSNTVNPKLSNIIKSSTFIPTILDKVYENYAWMLCTYDTNRYSNYYKALQNRRDNGKNLFKLEYPLLEFIFYRSHEEDKIKAVVEYVSNIDEARLKGI